MHQSLIPLIISIGVALVALILPWIIRSRFQTPRGIGSLCVRQSGHLGGQMMLPAGYSLFRRLDPLLAQLQIRAILTVSAPGALWAIYATAGIVDSATMSAGGLGILVVAGAVLEWYLISQYQRARDRYRGTKAGYEAKLCTAQALAQWVAPGDFICHEFRKDHMWIDHLLVSAKGIFLLQTHSPAACEPYDPEIGQVVTYDGRRLLFSHAQDDDGTVARACETAEQMSAWLSTALDNPVALRAIVCLPGWTVKRTSAEGIPVVNPRQFESLFRHISAWSLSPAEIKAVADVIMAACEDSVPDDI
jgi:hypothetical protein